MVFRRVTVLCCEMLRGGRAAQRAGYWDENGIEIWKPQLLGCKTVDLVHEFRSEAQLLVVSHQKRTMEAADCLYGVTMAPGGSSRVISERISVATPG